MSINTANPTDVFEAQLRADYEFEAEDTTIEEYISGPITDNFQGRLFVNAPDMSGGYFDNKAQSTDIGFFDIATGDLNVYNQVLFSAPKTKSLRCLKVILMCSLSVCDCCNAA